MGHPRKLAPTCQNNPTFINLDGLQQKILKLTSVILPDQVSECKDQPNPREVQPCELERHKQISEYKEEKKKSLTNYNQRYKSAAYHISYGCILQII